MKATGPPALTPARSNPALLQVPGPIAEVTGGPARSRLSLHPLSQPLRGVWHSQPVPPFSYSHLLTSMMQWSSGPTAQPSRCSSPVSFYGFSSSDHVFTTEVPRVAPSVFDPQSLPRKSCLVLSFEHLLFARDSHTCVPSPLFSNEHQLNTPSCLHGVLTWLIQTPRGRKGTLYQELPSVCQKHVLPNFSKWPNFTRCLNSKC